MSRPPLLLVIVCILSVASASVATADLMPLDAEDDGHFTGPNTLTTNAGDLVSGVNTAGSEFRPVLEFSLTPIPDGALITNATFSLFYLGEDAAMLPGGLPYGIYGYYGPNAPANPSTADGTLTSPDDFNSDAVRLATFEPGTATPNTRVSFDATAFLNGRSEDDDFIGFRISPDDVDTVPSGSGTTIRFASIEDTAANSEPQLDVNFTAAAVPEPSSLALCGLLGAGALLRRRLRRLRAIEATR